MFKGHRCWSTSPKTFAYYQNHNTNDDIMNVVSYNNIRLKCYINVSKCLLDILYIAPHAVAGSPILARAIDNFNIFLNKIKKINYKSNFSTETLPSGLIIHFKLLSASNFKWCFISLGIPVLKTLYRGFE